MFSSSKFWFVLILTCATVLLVETVWRHVQRLLITSHSVDEQSKIYSGRDVDDLRTFIAEKHKEKPQISYHDFDFQSDADQATVRLPLVVITVTQI
jgi:hypothetical protein